MNNNKHIVLIASLAAVALFVAAFFGVYIGNHVFSNAGISNTDISDAKEALENDLENDRLRNLVSNGHAEAVEPLNENNASDTYSNSGDTHKSPVLYDSLPADPNAVKILVNKGMDLKTAALVAAYDPYEDVDWTDIDPSDFPRLTIRAKLAKARTLEPNAALAVTDPVTYMITRGYKAPIAKTLVSANKGDNLVLHDNAYYDDQLARSAEAFKNVNS